jgi:hypothetical protein
MLNLCFVRNITLHREGRVLAKILIIFGRVTEWESSATGLMGINSAFAVGPRKSSENVIEEAGRRTFRMHTEFRPAIRFQIWYTNHEGSTYMCSFFIFRNGSIKSFTTSHVFIHTCTHTYYIYIATGWTVRRSKPYGGK